MITLTENDFDYQVMYYSYYQISFDPEKRAKDQIKRLVNYFNVTVQELEGLCKTDEQKEYLKSELPRFKEGYLSRNARITAARAQCASSMITGPANFPVRRIQKANEAERKRTEEYMAWDKKVIAALKKGIASRDPEEKDPMFHVKRMIDDSFLDYAFGRQNFYGRFQTWARKQTDEVVQQGLQVLKDWQEKNLEGKGFTARHGIWKTKGGITTTDPTIENQEVGGVKIIKNTDIDRIQLIFPGKPDADMIQRLKSSGWRWSPKNKAWQRQNTANAYRSAKEILNF